MSVTCRSVTFPSHVISICPWDFAVGKKNIHRALRVIALPDPGHCSLATRATNPEMASSEVCNGETDFRDAECMCGFGYRRDYNEV